MFQIPLKNFKIFKKRNAFESLISFKRVQYLKALRENIFYGPIFPVEFFNGGK